MTLILQQGLPAIELLRNEGINSITDEDVNPHQLPTLHIALLNLMPNKVVTEVQILRLLDHPDFNIRIHLLRTTSYQSKNTSAAYLDNFYKGFLDIDEKIDGLIITGADVEMMEFEAVDYWEELQQIMDWAEREVKSTFFICWAAQAGIYHHFGIGKHKMKEKLSGVFQHLLVQKTSPIAHQFEAVFRAPIRDIQS